MRKARALLFAGLASIATLSCAGGSVVPPVAPPAAAPAPAAPRLATVDPAPSARVNPFFEPSSLLYEAPPFDRIQEADYEPALEEGMRQQLAEIAKITAQTDAPTFENTIVAMERSEQLLNRVDRVFSAMTSANTSDALQRTAPCASACSRPRPDAPSTATPTTRAG